MTPITRAGSPELGAKIRARRNELGITIEAAAASAKVGSETWRRYEQGSSIRQDKVRGVCRALRWAGLPLTDGSASDAAGHDGPSMWDVAGPESGDGYSSSLAENYGEACARTFSLGYDLVSDSFKEVAQELGGMPRGTHIGELGGTMLDGDLPERWLTRYDFEFCHRMLATVRTLWLRLKAPGFDGVPFLTRCPADDLAVHLIMQAGAASFDTAQDERADEILVDVDEWIYELIGEDDETIPLLFADYEFPDATDSRHFERWFEPSYYSAPSGVAAITDPGT